ncbi:zinc ABC transporter substrate-binding protein [Coraliomargarita algicola]|uniref:Zinc ABC transporter substrate-binding protein n=1 Tax=Coraliomargarita algicola TaxID=3092156 RepID=A0ABZ0RRP0_9BACT|nr:zinc ABC transporter substrate-binding protein [Coraliomargarita sp. J2-16]WPJ97914.1 zinc ABC transporter substrate-binding protein [Coraliomargarita sp. J2-16]
MESNTIISWNRAGKLSCCLLAAVAVLVSGCVPQDAQDDLVASPRLEYPYQVGTTVAMLTDVVRKVAGEKAQVKGIIGEGIDPHLYKPTSSDVKLLQASDIIFYSGLNLEGKMGDVLVRMATSGKPVIAVTETLLNDGSYVMTDEADHYDPHVWMDVGGWIQATQVIGESLARFDPDQAELYRKNTQSYTAELERLHAYGKRAFATIPESQRVLVTAHDAFNYMGRAYGLQVRGIQGISTESEAGLKDINDLVDFLVDHQIPAVFVESSVSQKNVRALIEGARAKGHDVQIGGELFSDAMGETGTYEGTYIGMLDHNITTIVRALGGEAPRQGLNGQLTSH